MAANPVFEAARTVLAVREYEARPVPEATVGRILEAARLTASAVNRQPWHFVLVRDREALRRLGALAGTGPYIAGADLAVVVAINRQSRSGVSDGSRAIQSMILTAWAEGVGSNWVGTGGSGEIGEAVGIPAEYEVLAVVPFGYPARPAGKGLKKRKPAAEVISAERFGVPYDPRP